jgi:hypothetical protein
MDQFEQLSSNTFVLYELIRHMMQYRIFVSYGDQDIKAMFDHQLLDNQQNNVPSHNMSHYD